MIRIRSLTPIASLLALAALTFAPRAFADALPPNDCSVNAAVGSACTTAGPSYDEDGICQNEICTGSIHLPDGGFQTNSYPCILCELPDGGGADSGPSADSGTDSGSTPPPPPEDAGATPPGPDSGPAESDSGTSGADGNKQLASSSSCSVGFAGAPGSAGFLLALGGLGAIVSGLVRRRRKG